MSSVRWRAADNVQLVVVLQDQLQKPMPQMLSGGPDGQSLRYVVIHNSGKLIYL